MTRPAVRVESLSKCYRIGSREPYHRFSELLLRWGRRAIIAPREWMHRARLGAVPNGNPHDPASNHFWALKDVSFEVHEGEVLGIVGRNGAGKSTLLKILARITEPTAGRFGLRGRVASLLEVGTGFHPELTGRDNIYLNGAVLGMTRKEIHRKFDEIVAFAETERFLETPVKHYSSGMHMRLAFAVAAHLEPEILIVDEVLAVGDPEFQKKCIGRMGEVARSGRTVLLVSHDLNSIATLADRCILLHAGKLLSADNTATVLNTYAESLHRSEDTVYEDAKSQNSPKVIFAAVETSSPGNLHLYGRPLRVRLEIATPRALANARVSFQFVNARGTPVAHLWTFDSDRPMLRSAGHHRLVCTIDSPRLYMGRYTLNVYFGETVLRDICPFEVSMREMPRELPWQPDTCAYLEDASWEIHDVPTDSLEGAHGSKHYYNEAIITTK